MKDIAIDVFLASKSKLNPNKRRNCFELLGFDFMIDEDFRTWLIECNTNPSLSLHNKSLKPILPKMLNEMFKIVLDPIFDSYNSAPNPEKGSDFELLYSRSRGINKRRPAGEGIYPVQSLDSRKVTRKIKVKKERPKVHSIEINTSVISKEGKDNEAVFAQNFSIDRLFKKQNQNSRTKLLSLDKADSELPSKSVKKAS